MDWVVTLYLPLETEEMSPGAVSDLVLELTDDLHEGSFAFSVEPTTDGVAGVFAGVLGRNHPDARIITVQQGEVTMLGPAGGDA